ncbi:hypothetical protein [Streptomyces sp. NPDC001401]|uniref:hypothetical protein n=1 Tax=Streptomyces sp. NPDC001401 TaxID=3364570 RepID=UPI0036BEB631
MRPSSAVRFATFCHISELGAPGYRELHRMLAASSPLTLWAPSSVLLQDRDCRITPARFVEYVENGHIRIVARRKWLIDREARDNHPWPGARWDTTVDGAIRSIMEDDLSIADRSLRRVVAADDEQGWEFAEAAVEEDPEGTREWARLLASDEAEHVVPPGTLETARRVGGDDPHRQVVAVLRDAYNHGHAVRESDADIPFLMRSTDQAFITRIASMSCPPPLPHLPQPAQPAGVSTLPVGIADVTGQLLDVLRSLETRRTDVGKFVGTTEHAALVAWVAAVCERVKTQGVAAANVDVARELAAQLARGGFPGLRLSELGRRWTAGEAAAAAVASLDLWLTLNPLVTGSPGVNDLLGMLTAAFPVGRGLCKRVGLVPGLFEGEQWPFLYAGRKATRRSVPAVVAQLDEPAG